MCESAVSAETARQYVCQLCGTTATAIGSRGPVPKCCNHCASRHKSELASRARNKRSARGYERTCRHCKKLWLAKSDRARFCSKECQYLASGNRVLIECLGCGKTFGHTKARSSERRYCSQECFAAHAWTATRTCQECGKSFRRAPTSKDKAKYCGRSCYFAARKAGRQPWDRTAQSQSAWHRGGRWANPPSRKPMQEMMQNLGLFLAKVRKLYAKAAEPQPVCEVCSQPCHTGSRFCSLKCIRRNTAEVPCKKCGKPAIARGAFRSAACSDCQRQAKTEENRRAKQKYGRNHRQRARHHGVKYVAFPVRDIYERDGYRCQLCGKAVLPKAAYRKRDGKIHPRSPTIDHIVPMCRGGNHEPDNCQTACFICNSRKSSKGGWQLRLALTSAPLG